MSTNEGITNIILSATDKVATKLKRDFMELENLQSSGKSVNTFTIAAINKAKDVIVKNLTKARPDCNCIIEGYNNIIDANNKLEWLIIPVSGKTNLLHSIPHFATVIALRDNGKITVCIIYSIVDNSIYKAYIGKGAFLNDKKIKVSPRKLKDNALVVISGKGVSKLPKVPNIRFTGSVILDLAFVASGKYDACIMKDTDSLEAEIGCFLLKEAKGKIGYINDKKDIVIGNADIVNEITSL